ncbi:hypothetical protein TNCV_1145851 [Trichonephila clavipes]|nr:hypothetical protein TNCV_1145851 [Trichonephila clavipes]
MSCRLLGVIVRGEECLASEVVRSLDGDSKEETSSPIILILLNRECEFTRGLCRPLICLLVGMVWYLGEINASSSVILVYDRGSKWRGSSPEFLEQLNSAI